MNDSELRQQITVIANRFRLFECVECAIAIRQFLISQNIPGKSISLYTGSTKEPLCNIYHDRLQENISTNGRHEAIAVEIDNIDRVGISRLDWIKNLYCPIVDLGADFQITETEF
jgi:hypothetical protein